MRLAGTMAVLVPLAMLGAGWLTGREWLHSFTYYGTWGTIGLTASLCFLAWLCTRMVAVCQEQNIASLSAFFAHLAGEKAGPSLHFAYQALLLLYGGGLLAQVVLPAVHATEGSLWLIIVLAAGLIATLAAASLRWHAAAAAALLMLALTALGLVYSEQRYIPLPSLSYQLNLQWLWQAILFTALHFMPLPAILVPLTHVAGNPAALRRGLWMGGAAALLLAMLTHLAMLAFWHDIHTARFPLLPVFAQLLPRLDLAVQLFSLAQGIVMLALWLWGLSQSLAIRHELNRWPLVLTYGCLLLLFALPPLVGSTTYLSVLSTLVAYAATVWLAACLHLWLRQRPKRM